MMLMLGDQVGYFGAYASLISLVPFISQLENIFLLVYILQEGSPRGSVEVKILLLSYTYIAEIQLTGDGIRFLSRTQSAG